MPETRWFVHVWRRSWKRTWRVMPASVLRPLTGAARVLVGLDNNISEVELRRQVVGRHSWTFAGSDDGAEWNAIATTLIASCQHHGIEPWAYVGDVLTRAQVLARDSAAAGDSAAADCSAAPRAF